MPKVKKIPQRMCVGCREMVPKKQLLRLVRTTDNAIEIDLTGKKAGRGAYICLEKECLDKARKGKKLERAFQAPISPSVYSEIEDSIKKLMEQKSTQSQ